LFSFSAYIDTQRQVAISEVVRAAKFTVSLLVLLSLSLSGNK